MTTVTTNSMGMNLIPPAHDHEVGFHRAKLGSYLSVQLNVVQPPHGDPIAPRQLGPLVLEIFLEDAYWYIALTNCIHPPSSATMEWKHLKGFYYQPFRWVEFDPRCPRMVEQSLEGGSHMNDLNW
eukprot:494020-Amphidinium_carterae.1